MHIALIHQRGQTPEHVRGYLISALENRWREAGHRVLHLFGPDHFVEADVALVHVDLSVVPEAYFQLACRYPRALNLHVTDIRKSRFSQLLLTREEDYAGPVIVKSDLNHGGKPEKDSESYLKKPWYSFLARRPGLSSFLNYGIYPSLSEVPAGCWKNPALVVEKFLPETRDGFYFLRQSYFLGSRHRSWRLRSDKPIVRADDCLDDEEIATPAEVEAFRRQAGLDYGKIDFVEHEGRISVLDLNKTIGGSSTPLITTDWLAPAIEEFLPMMTPL